MDASLNEESYALVLKMANKFAYGPNSIKYEELVNAGITGLVKAIKTYKADNGASFSTYATSCIRNEMCTRRKRQGRFDLVQDENIELDEIDTLMTETPDDNMEDVAKSIILKVNRQNERNANIFMQNIGLTCDNRMDYKELSVKFKMTAERVRQICVNTSKAIKRDRKLSNLLYSYVG